MARRSARDFDWATLRREWRTSGLTQPEFCRRGGLAPGADLEGDAAGVLKSPVVQTDDTPVPVLDRRLDRTRQVRLWVYLGVRDQPYAVYDYTADRSREGPERFLGDYTGYLQADAFSAYDWIYPRGVVEVGCFAHARRKFYEAWATAPERAHEALARIRRLYEVERAAKDLDDAARLALRREWSAPMLGSLGAWLEQQSLRVLPRSPIGQAVGYARSN
jgi:hypothetical protein